MLKLEAGSQGRSAYCQVEFYCLLPSRVLLPSRLLVSWTLRQSVKSYKTLQGEEGSAFVLRNPCRITSVTSPLFALVKTQFHSCAYHVSGHISRHSKTSLPIFDRELVSCPSCHEPDGGDVRKGRGGRGEKAGKTAGCGRSVTFLGLPSLPTVNLDCQMPKNPSGLPHW